jgi:hypothetical protein
MDNVWCWLEEAFLLSVENENIYFVAPSLTRGQICNLLYNCFCALPEQSLWGPSPAELKTIFLLSHLRLPTWTARSNRQGIGYNGLKPINTRIIAHRTLKLKMEAVSTSETMVILSASTRRKHSRAESTLTMNRCKSLKSVKGLFYFFV